MNVNVLYKLVLGILGGVLLLLAGVQAAVIHHYEKPDTLFLWAHLAALLAAGLGANAVCFFRGLRVRQASAFVSLMGFIALACFSFVV